MATLLAPPLWRFEGEKSKILSIKDKFEANEINMRRGYPSSMKGGAGHIKEAYLLVLGFLANGTNGFLLLTIIGMFDAHFYDSESQIERCVTSL
jgi:hypothetical protein